MRRCAKTGRSAPSPPPPLPDTTGPPSRSAYTDSRACWLSPQAGQTLREHLQLAAQRAHSRLRGPVTSASPEAAR
jgi:hypothetical protein